MIPHLHQLNRELQHHRINAELRCHALLEVGFVVIGEWLRQVEVAADQGLVVRLLDRGVMVGVGHGLLPMPWWRSHARMNSVGPSMYARLRISSEISYSVIGWRSGCDWVENLRIASPIACPDIPPSMQADRNASSAFASGVMADRPCSLAAS